ncbi:hypothetical protein VTN00DRAFT_6432 [Thermoascus crustaceus]|uniref:uncharacterized protein n=1 Tax=Thermoascus crustaceus TaxID=5088 RepID=UPI0037421362
MLHLGELKIWMGRYYQGRREPSLATSGRYKKGNLSPAQPPATRRGIGRPSVFVWVLTSTIKGKETG